VIKLAEKKAEELEDFKTSEPLHTPEVMEEGTAIITEFLRTWASRTEEVDDDGDQVMMLPTHDYTERQVAELRRCFDEFKPRIEGNAWCQSVLSSL